MKNVVILLLVVISFKAHAQVSPTSGDYGELHIAFDKTTRTVSGYYESGSGYDEKTKSSRFTCIFYIEGKLAGNKVKIKTYFPKDMKGDLIVGDLTVVNAKELKIHLPEEHGGCMNVQHFADRELARFYLDKPANWVQVRYAISDKVYFHSNKADANKQKAYILKGDVVYIEKIEGAWAFCSYRGGKTTTGWIRLQDLNVLN